jgi:prepilin-type N-terminal cleavage/methylation domain-containing protein
MRPRQSPAQRGRRAAFTLLELLITLGIILILATLTMRLLNATLNSDRIRTGSRELQSFLGGARDRAVYAGQRRGVRLIQDPLDPSCARSFVYIGAPDNFSQGMIDIPGTPWTTGATVQSGQLSQYVIPSGLVAGNNPPFVYSATTIPPAGGTTGATEPTWPTTMNPPNNFVVDNNITWTCIGIVNRFIDTTTGANNSWQQLAARGVLTNGCELDVNGGVYTVTQASNGSWNLTKDFAATAAVPPESTLWTYTLHLAPSILPGEEPRTLPQNIAVDLDNSLLPTTWGAPGGFTGPFDLLFSPSGTVTGTTAAAGKIHFVLSEYVDASVPVPSPPAALTSGVPLMDINSAWQANTPYTAQSSWVVPSPQNDLAFQCIASTGNSGATQPTAFATAVPGQVVPGDGGVTWQCFSPRPRLIVTVATETGRITTSPVNPLDKFRYAEIGEVTQ